MSYIMIDIESDGPIPGDYSIYKGVVRDVSKNFKHLRKTKHTHNPVDDAKGNAEAFLEIIEQYQVKIRI